MKKIITLFVLLISLSAFSQEVNINKKDVIVSGFFGVRYRILKY